MTKCNYWGKSVYKCLRREKSSFGQKYKTEKSKVSTACPMARSIKVNGLKMTLASMEPVFSLTNMETYTRVIFKMDSTMAQGGKSKQTEVCMMGNGLTGKNKVGGAILTNQVNIITENGRKTNEMELEIRYTKTVTHTKVNSKMT